VSAAAATFDAVYFDGRTTARHPVRATAANANLEIAGEGLSVEYPLALLRVRAQAAGAPQLVLLPDGGQLQTEAVAALEALFPHAGRHWLRRAESGWLASILAVAFVAGLAAWTLKVGIPRAAETLAARLPASVSRDMGQQTLNFLDTVFCTPTEVPMKRQQAIDKELARVVRGVPRWGDYHIEFRHCAGIGANALALPDSTIVMTDDLVELAASDLELAAVLAHEVGHVVHRHPMRMSLQAAGVGIVMAGMFSDTIALTGLAAALPSLLIESGYSRAFEDAADEFALEKLREVGIPRRHFADILEKLELAHGERKAVDGDAFDYLSTHPASVSRIERARRAP